MLVYTGLYGTNLSIGIVFCVVMYHLVAYFFGSSHKINKHCDFRAREKAHKILKTYNVTIQSSSTQANGVGHATDGTSSAIAHSGSLVAPSKHQRNHSVWFGFEDDVALTEGSSSAITHSGTPVAASKQQRNELVWFGLEDDVASTNGTSSTITHLGRVVASSEHQRKKSMWFGFEDNVPSFLSISFSSGTGGLYSKQPASGHVYTMSKLSSQSTTLKVMNEMQASGTVVPANFDHLTNGKDSRIRSENVYWKGNGIPNSTSKYKEDQKVCWHSTPFEERLEKAIVAESCIKKRRGTPRKINFGKI